MKNLFLSIIDLLRRYFILILLIIIAGNIIRFLSLHNQQSFYEYKVSVNANADLYNSVKYVFDNASNEFANESNQNSQADSIEKSKIIEIKSTSFRNESIYISELTIDLKDTLYSESILKKIKKYIETDKTLKEYHFDLDKRLTDIRNQYEKLEAEVLLQPQISIEARTNLLNIKANLFQFDLQIHNLKTQFTIHYPTANGFVFINAQPTFKSYLLASILSFIIALALVIVIEQFKTASQKTE